MKDKILELLLQNKDYISGQELSRLFGVSRAAIWKNIQQLREDGCVVEAVTRKGYRLLHKADIITEDQLKRMLLAAGLGDFVKSVVYLDETDSTNRLARSTLEQSPADAALFVAGRQTAGRGRRGRQWLSDHDQGLWFSLMLQPHYSADVLARVTLLAGLAAALALQEEYGIAVGIKWPNDLVYQKDGRKIGGILSEILIEDQSPRAVIIGLGLNLNNETFPMELSRIAVSMRQISNHIYSRGEVLTQILKAFFQLYPDITRPEQWLPAYRQNCLTLGRLVRAIAVDGSVLTGQAIDIDEAGELVICDDLGVKHVVRSGEVSVRGLLGEY